MISTVVEKDVFQDNLENVIFRLAGSDYKVQSLVVSSYEVIKNEVTNETIYHALTYTIVFILKD